MKENKIYQVNDSSVLSHLSHRSRTLEGDIFRAFMAELRGDQGANVDFREDTYLSVNVDLNEHCIDTSNQGELKAALYLLSRHSFSFDFSNDIKKRFGSVSPIESLAIDATGTVFISISAVCRRFFIDAARENTGATIDEIISLNSNNPDLIK